jgi:uncharacterized protein (DUF2249 family)
MPAVLAWVWPGSAAQRWSDLALSKIKNNKNTMTTKTASIIGEDKVMDVRPIPCSIKHGLILRTWFNLPLGEHFILLNDHDPVPLWYQFQAEFPGAFSWDYVQRGPDEFRVKITKLAEVSTVELVSPCGGAGH